jgi:hypothetical protein
MAEAITTGLRNECASAPSDQDHLNTYVLSVRKAVASEVDLQHWQAKVGMKTAFTDVQNHSPAALDLIESKPNSLQKCLPLLDEVERPRSSHEE